MRLGEGSVPGVVEPGGFQTANVVTLGALSWGEFTNGDVTLRGNAISLDSGKYMPYVVGLDATSIPSGELSFSLDNGSATAVRQMSGDPVVGSNLDSFNLKLNLAASVYSMDMQLSAGSFGVYNANGSGALGSNGTNDFGFIVDDSVGSVVNSIAGCASSSRCSLEVEGFLAGPGAGQAGVSYMLVDDGNAFIGAAGLLKKTP
ncbi:hypothetical protein H0A66_13455 [Alcaligenaceae bacterium]|nr:hypothetical protein [Alcaligenaceae bacterium]